MGLKEGKRPIVVKQTKPQITMAGTETILTVKKYAREIFHNNLWNEYPEAIKNRGAVFIGDTPVVSPMDKCFNYKENGVGLDVSDETHVNVYHKINGYMANLTYINGTGWIISTTGDAFIVGNKTENKYLTMAQQYFERFDAYAYYLELSKAVDFNIVELDNQPPLTITFEIVHPDDPHIVEELYGVYALCYQVGDKHRPCFDIFTVRHCVVPVRGKVTTFGEVKRELQECKHEGFMVYNLNHKLLFKLKSPYYLAKKWVQRRSADHLWSPLYKSRMEEEYYPIVVRIREKLTKEEWDALDEQGKSSLFLEVYKELLG